MIEPGSIPVGVFAFGNEGDQLGEVTEVGGSGLVVRDDSGTMHWVPLHAVEGISAGKLVLRGKGLP
jgi:hypothetical protein